MSRNEFLKTLEENLELYLDKEQINSQLDYYDKYITDEVDKGRNESEVLEELGDPRLIAKTIKTVEGSKKIVDVDNSESGESNSSNQRDSSGSRTYTGPNGRVYTFNSNAGIIGCVLLLLILFIIGAVILKLLGYLAVGAVGVAYGLGPVGILVLILIFWILMGNNRR